MVYASRYTVAVIRLRLGEIKALMADPLAAVYSIRDETFALFRTFRMTPRHQRHDRSKPTKKPRASGDKGQKVFDLGSFLHAEMERCPTAEKLHEKVIEPFLSALVSTCNARGYVLNIYGENCNLAVAPGSHAEQIYRLIDAYLEEADLE